MEDQTLDLIGGYDPIEQKLQEKAVEEMMKEVDEENENEFVEAGLPYVKLSQKLPNYKFK